MCVRICFEFPQPFGFRRFCLNIPCYIWPPIFHHDPGDPPPWWREIVEIDGKPPVWLGDAHALAGLQGVLKQGGLSAEVTRAFEAVSKDIAASIHAQLPKGATLSLGEENRR
jgi:hypothetical protein